MPDALTPRSQPTTVYGVPSPTRDEQPVRGYAADLRAGDPDTWTIALQGQVDADEITRLLHEMTGALTGYDRIVVDLRDVSLLSAPTFALLCCALRRAHHPDARLVIAHAAPAAHRALELCELPGVELHPRATSRPPGHR
jgi:ABC-type transporter Mla MlaB component